MSYLLKVDKTPESVYRQAAAEFIIIELDLAFTFCQLALSTNNLVRADRNINNARRSLQTALSVEKHVDVRLQDKQIIDLKIFHVESLLAELARNGGSADSLLPAP